MNQMISWCGTKYVREVGTLEWSELRLVMSDLDETFTAPSPHLPIQFAMLKSRFSVEFRVRKLSERSEKLPRKFRIVAIIVQPPSPNRHLGAVDKADKRTPTGHAGEPPAILRTLQQRGLRGP